MNKIASNWKDYQCLYAGDGQKIERWKNIILKRPDSMAIWQLPDVDVEIDAIYHRSINGGGNWQFINDLPENWQINYENLCFKVAPLGFKHTGIFPEQAANWDTIKQLIEANKRKEFKILNLFAYTGGATLCCAAAGATEVVHVDASKGMVQWAKENYLLSNLKGQIVRFIVDDCLKFILREQRRNRTYQAIIMDPPSYGRGPNNEVWKFDQQINYLIDEATKLLADDAVFFLVNTYTTGYSSTVINNILQANKILSSSFKTIETGELLLPVTKQDVYLPSGIYGITYNS